MWPWLSARPVRYCLPSGHSCTAHKSSRCVTSLRAGRCRRWPIMSLGARRIVRSLPITKNSTLRRFWIGSRMARRTSSAHDQDRCEANTPTRLPSEANTGRLISTNFMASPVGLGSSLASSTASCTSPINTFFCASRNTGRWPMLAPSSTPSLEASTVPWVSVKPIQAMLGNSVCRRSSNTRTSTISSGWRRARSLPITCSMAARLCMSRSRRSTIIKETSARSRPTSSRMRWLASWPIRVPSNQLRLATSRAIRMAKRLRRLCDEVMARRLLRAGRQCTDEFEYSAPLVCMAVRQRQLRAARADSSGVYSPAFPKV